MWIVYNKEDSAECGWEVETEAEAIRQCEEDNNLIYVWKNHQYIDYSSYYDYYYQLKGVDIYD